jgi:hypothetical protein
MNAFVRGSGAQPALDILIYSLMTSYYALGKVHLFNDFM